VQDDLRDRNSLKDATRILVQITNLHSIEKMVNLETDIYIKPDIKDYGLSHLIKEKKFIFKCEELHLQCMKKNRNI
jgi:NTE family protein